MLFLRHRYYSSGTDTFLSESSTPNSCARIGLVGPCTTLPRLMDDVQMGSVLAHMMWKPSNEGDVAVVAKVSVLLGKSNDCCSSTKNILKYPYHHSTARECFWPRSVFIGYFDSQGENPRAATVHGLAHRWAAYQTCLLILSSSAQVLIAALLIARALQ